MAIDLKAFLALAERRFPELREDFEFFEGLSHLNVASLRSLTQEAIEKGDFQRVTESYEIANMVRVEGNDELRNAIHVSYLEHLDFRGKNGPRAFELMPDALKDAWDDINSYMEEILEGNWERKTRDSSDSDV